MCGGGGGGSGGTYSPAPIRLKERKNIRKEKRGRIRKESLELIIHPDWSFMGFRVGICLSHTNRQRERDRDRQTDQ